MASAVSPGPPGVLLPATADTHGHDVITTWALSPTRSCTCPKWIFRPSAEPWGQRLADQPWSKAWARGCCGRRLTDGARAEGRSRSQRRPQSCGAPNRASRRSIAGGPASCPLLNFQGCSRTSTAQPWEECHAKLGFAKWHDSKGSKKSLGWDSGRQTQSYLLRTAGSVWGWGWGDFLQLGENYYLVYSDASVLVPVVLRLAEGLSSIHNILEFPRVIPVDLEYETMEYLGKCFQS